ncbi:MAG TPA: hypothetical protein VKB41_06960 [Steroidobacteraceae bacterium]|nr:hypothetical protein [Steroidobacteraceae bacterium]
MRYVLVAILLLGAGVWIGTQWHAQPQPTDPLTVIVTQLKTQAIIEHERQIAVWYKACPEVVGVNPQMFVAWPGKLSFELPLDDVKLERSGATLTVRTSGIRPDEPALPTDSLEYLSTEPILNLVNEAELVNGELRKASGIARYLSSYYLKRDTTLHDAMAEELKSLVARIAGAIDAGITDVRVEIPRPDPKLPPLPKLELCPGSMADVNGLPFAKDESGYLVPVAFRAPPPSGKPAESTERPRGAAVIYEAQKK